MPAIKLHVSVEELEGIERVRGGVPRERWLRELAGMAVQRRDEFGRACVLTMRASDPEPRHVPVVLPVVEVEGDG